MRTADFDFFLPPELIAQYPVAERTASRLLYLNGNKQERQDKTFRDITEFMHPGDMLVFNDTRVIKARLFGQKASGGQVEVMIERILDTHKALAYIRASKSPALDSVLTIAGAFEIQVIGRKENLFLVKSLSEAPLTELLDLHGHLPLPPYIEHHADMQDEERYQTVYAKHAGAVAAPTAGLHFDDTLLDTLKQHGIHLAFITLHVGAGTFQPVKVDAISDHKMHSERYTIPRETAELISDVKRSGGRITGVGTTALRALESAARDGHLLNGGEGETDIFITPGFQFQVVDRLITNFHLPKSTLMMLVSAFAGYPEIMAAYQHAIEQRYRFFSYGDAMLLERLQP